MPIYEYRCSNGHRFEIFQSMSDDPLSSCEVCGAASQRVLSAPAVHFKGSGFYTTDYARKGAGKSSDDGGSSEDGAKKSDSGSKSESGSKSDSNAGSKAKTGSASD